MGSRRIKRRKRVNPPLFVNETFQPEGVETENKKKPDIVGKKSLFNRYVVLLMGAAVVTLSLLTAETLGWFNGGTNGNKPDVSVVATTEPVSSKAPLSSQNSETSQPPNSSGQPGDEDKTPTSVPEAVVTSSTVEATPPPDKPLLPYQEMYADLVVPKTEYIEHDPDDKVVYLSFDDGPCKSTTRLLDVLDELDIKVTFFVSAQFGGREELLENIKEMADRGHTVAVHTYTHTYSEIYSTVEAFLEDYKKMDDIILEATGKRSGIYRFPGGSNTGYNIKIRNELITEMNRRGFVYHDWNAHNGDSEGHGAQAQVERTVREVSNGSKSVVLMHNTPDKDTVIDVLPQIVQQLKEKGYRFDIMDETVRPFQFVTV